MAFEGFQFPSSRVKSLVFPCSALTQVQWMRHTSRHAARAAPEPEGISDRRSHLLLALLDSLLLGAFASCRWRRGRRRLCFARDGHCVSRTGGERGEPRALRWLFRCFYQGCIVRVLCDLPTNRCRLTSSGPKKKNLQPVARGIVAPS